MQQTLVFGITSLFAGIGLFFALEAIIDVELPSGVSGLIGVAFFAALLLTR